MSDSFNALIDRQKQVLRSIEKLRTKLDQAKIDQPLQDTGKVDKTIHHWQQLKDQSESRLGNLIRKEEEDILRAREKMERDIREAQELFERKRAVSDASIKTNTAELNRLTGFYNENVSKLLRSKEHIMTNLPPKVAKAQAELDAEVAKQKVIESMILTEIRGQIQSGPTGPRGPIEPPYTSPPPPVAEKKPIKKIPTPVPEPVAQPPPPPVVNTVVLPPWDSGAEEREEVESKGEEEEEEDADAFQMRSFMAYLARKKEAGEFEYEGLTGYPAWQKWEQMSLTRWPQLKKDMYKDF